MKVGKSPRSGGRGGRRWLPGSWAHFLKGGCQLIQGTRAPQGKTFNPDFLSVSVTLCLSTFMLQNLYLDVKGKKKKN